MLLGAPRLTYAPRSGSASREEIAERSVASEPAGASLVSVRRQRSATGWSLPQKRPLLVEESRIRA
jgi:hypothetical protein